MNLLVASGLILGYDRESMEIPAGDLGQRILYGVGRPLRAISQGLGLAEIRSSEVGESLGGRDNLLRLMSGQDIGPVREATQANQYKKLTERRGLAEEKLVAAKATRNLTLDDLSKLLTTEANSWKAIAFNLRGPNKHLSASAQKAQALFDRMDGVVSLVKRGRQIDRISQRTIEAYLKGQAEKNIPSHFNISSPKDQARIKRAAVYGALGRLFTSSIQHPPVPTPEIPPQSAEAKLAITTLDGINMSAIFDAKNLIEAHTVTVTDLRRSSEPVRDQLQARADYLRAHVQRIVADAKTFSYSRGMSPTSDGVTIHGTIAGVPAMIILSEESLGEPLQQALRDNADRMHREETATRETITMYDAPLQKPLTDNPRDFTVEIAWDGDHTERMHVRDLSAVPAHPTQAPYHPRYLSWQGSRRHGPAENETWQRLVVQENATNPRGPLEFTLTRSHQSVEATHATRYEREEFLLGSNGRQITRQRQIDLENPANPEMVSTKYRAGIDLQSHKGWHVDRLEDDDLDGKLRLLGQDQITVGGTLIPEVAPLFTLAHTAIPTSPTRKK